MNTKSLKVYCVKSENRQQRRVHHYKVQLLKNRTEMKQLAKLAQCRCDPTKALDEQPRCKFIIEQMKEIADKGRELDLDYLMYDLMSHEDDEEPLDM